MTTMDKRLVGLLLGMGLGMGMAAAQAAPTLWVYGAYGYSNPTTGANYNIFTPGNLTHVDANASFASMASMNGPVAQAYVGTSGSMYTGLPNANAQASAAVQYDFYVVNGLTFSDLVPITVKGQAFMSGTSDAVASGYARVVHSNTLGGVNNGSFGNQVTNWTCGGGGSDCGLFDFEYTFYVSAFAFGQPGEIARVNLLAAARLNNSLYATQASAWVDPIITIDPAYLASHPGAALVYDPSITNAIGVVPEPSVGALLLAGLAVVGTRLRRRQGR